MVKGGGVMGSRVGRGGGYLAGVRAGGRELAPRANAVLALLTPALLAAVVVTGTFGESGHLTIDEKPSGWEWRRSAEGPLSPRRGSHRAC
jgi:hypothetical protein